jgi:hypothetical protein
VESEGGRDILADASARDGTEEPLMLDGDVMMDVE